MTRLRFLASLLATPAALAAVAASERPQPTTPFSGEVRAGEARLVVRDGLVVLSADEIVARSFSPTS